MRKFLTVPFVLSLVFGFQATVLSQSAEKDLEAHDRKIQEAVWQNYVNIVTGKTPPRPNEPPKVLDISETQNSVNRPSIFSPEELKQRRDALARLAVIRKPNDDDVAKNKEFLSQRNTGIFKLFPDLGCVNGRVVKVVGNCENAVLDSDAYSFEERDYFRLEHDLRLERGKLVLDGFLSQAMIADIGNIPLESVSLKNSYADFINNFKPSKVNSEARRQFEAISNIQKSNDFNYGKVVSPSVETTYLARIINYRVDLQDYRPAIRKGNLGKEFFIPGYNRNRSDTIIAFRVVRVDSDNSITILWKRLSKDRSPTLVFEKDEKWLDFKVK